MNRKTQDNLRRILTDIRFWIIFFFLLRLIGITNPPLETGHNWRQSLTNMVARNFHQNTNLLYPTIDMAGEKTGIIGSEFPFFNYLIYLFSTLFGNAHWYGRLINLIVSSFGLYFFYKLIRDLISREVAFNATIILITSIWFSFSRKIMPDSFSVSLVIIGMYYAYQYLKNAYKLNLIIFFAFCTLGILCKIPALSIFSCLALPFFIQKISLRKKIMLYLTATVSFSIVCLWYFYWVPHLLKVYQYQLYFPKKIAEGVREIIPLIPELLEKFYFSSLNSYIAFAFFIGGAIFIFKSKNIFLKGGIGIIAIVFALFIIKTGAVFPLHNYYIIPFTPIMALITGYCINKISFKYQYILLGLIVIEGVANQQHDFFINDHQQYKLQLEEITNKHIPKDDLVIINGGQSPQDIYFSGRKGFTITNELIRNTSQLDSLINLGGKYLIIDKSKLNYSNQIFQVLHDDEHYSVYKLDN